MALRGSVPRSADPPGRASRKCVLTYESALKTDKFVLVVHGVEDEVIAARRIITTTEAAEVALHAAERADQTIAPVTA